MRFARGGPSSWNRANFKFMLNKTTALFGGETVSVQKADGSTEEIFVRIVPIKEFPRIMVNLENESALAEIYCNKPAGWSDSLPNESIQTLINLGEKLNDDFFVSWATRRLARLNKAMPGLTERLVSNSPTGSQK
jgi:hypothetical protein